MATATAAPARRLRSGALTDLWSARELLRNLIAKELKVRHPTEPPRWGHA